MGPYGGTCPFCSTSVYQVGLEMVKPGVVRCPQCKCWEVFPGGSLACPNCNQLVYVPFEGVGTFHQQVPCPTCKGTLVISYQLSTQPKETDMNAPTSPQSDLLTFFEIDKPEAQQTEESKTSKPNLPKTQHLTKAVFVGVMSAQSGMGTALATSLGVVKLVSTFILQNVGAEHFDKTKATILGQLAILTDSIKQLSLQGVVANWEQFKKELDAAKAPKGAVGKETGDETKAEDEQVEDPTEAAMKAALETALNQGKKKDNVH